MLIIGHPDEIRRFLTAIEGSYKRSKRELFGTAALCIILFGGGLVLLRAAIASIGTDAIGTILFFFVLAIGVLVMPFWLYYTLAQQRYTFEPQQIAGWRGSQKLWSVDRANIDRIMYSKSGNGVIDLTFYLHKGKAQSFACTEELDHRIKAVLSQWSEPQAEK